MKRLDVMSSHVFFFRFLFRFYINLFLSGSTQTVLSIFTRTVFFFLIYSLKTK